jgi:hypothetical protein
VTDDDDSDVDPCLASEGAWYWSIHVAEVVSRMYQQLLVFGGRSLCGALTAID